MDYDNDDGLGKIGSMVIYLIKCIFTLKKKQLDRIDRTSRMRKTRSRVAPVQEEKLNKDFIIAMDNYFTLPKLIKCLRDLRIGVVGTARFGRGWPPVQLKNVEDRRAQFNSFHWMCDTYGTMVARWMDNGMVLQSILLGKLLNALEENLERPSRIIFMLI